MSWQVGDRTKIILKDDAYGWIDEAVRVGDTGVIDRINLRDIHPYIRFVSDRSGMGWNLPLRCFEPSKGPW